MSKPNRRQPQDTIATATPRQLRQISAIVGHRNITPLAVSPDGSAVYLAEGPAILAQIAAALPDEQRAPLRSWSNLTPECQRHIAAFAAGQPGWRHEYAIPKNAIRQYLIDNPQIVPAITTPAGAET